MWDTSHDCTRADYPNGTAGEPYALHYSLVTWLLVTTKTTAYSSSWVLNIAWSLSTDHREARVKGVTQGGAPPTHPCWRFWSPPLLFALSFWRRGFLLVELLFLSWANKHFCSGRLDVNIVGKPFISMSHQYTCPDTPTLVTSGSAMWRVLSYHSLSVVVESWGLFTWPKITCSFQDFTGLPTQETLVMVFDVGKQWNLI